MHAGYNVLVDAFKDGRIDLLVAVATPKHPSISEITTFAEVRFLPIAPERAQGLAALGYKAATMPPDTFKGQTQPVPTVGFPTVLIANKDLPEPIAYTITKTVVESKDALVRGHAGLAEFDPKIAWQPDEVGLPLHPGAARAVPGEGVDEIAPRPAPAVARSLQHPPCRCCGLTGARVALGAGWSLFQLYTAWAGAFDLLIQLPVHAACAVALGFLTPADRTVR